jgi:hypothetical protein
VGDPDLPRVRVLAGMRGSSDEEGRTIFSFVLQATSFLPIPRPFSVVRRFRENVV